MPPRSKLSDELLQQIAERLRNGSSINREALLVGCYHATLRRRLRRVLGREAFDRLPRSMARKRKRVARRGARSERNADGKNETRSSDA